MGGGSLPAVKLAMIVGLYAPLSSCLLSIILLYMLSACVVFFPPNRTLCAIHVGHYSHSNGFALKAFAAIHSVQRRLLHDSSNSHVTRWFVLGSPVVFANFLFSFHLFATQ